MTRALLVALAATIGLAAGARADDYFIESDAYEDGEEIVGRFLVEDDYRIMIEDLERNGVTFDWGWALTPGWGSASPTPEPIGRRSLRDRLKRRPKAGRTIQEPSELGFAVSDYTTIYLPPVESFVAMLGREVPEAVHANFALAAGELGWQLVDDPAEADLHLGLAIVDLKREGTYVYFATVDPFITIELRLHDRRSAVDLLLLRNRAHSGNPADASLRFATQLVGFLR